MSDTPRTDAEYERLFEIYRNAERFHGPLCCAFENDMRLCRQLERELNAANDKIKRLEEEVQELKVVNEYAWQKNGKLNDRIRHLIKLGLETAEYGLQNHREQWEQEEEL